jgi:hypothetical protein
MRAADKEKLKRSTSPGCRKDYKKRRKSGTPFADIRAASSRILEISELLGACKRIKWGEARVQAWCFPDLYFDKYGLAWRAEIKEASKQDSAISRTVPGKSLQGEVVETHGGAAVYNKLSVGVGRGGGSPAHRKETSFCFSLFSLGIFCPTHDSDPTGGSRVQSGTKAR